MRYVLMPGHVRSRYDGDDHYVGVNALLDLYKVPRGARWVRGDSVWHQPAPGDVVLRPRTDGGYRPVSEWAPNEGDSDG